MNLISIWGVYGSNPGLNLTQDFLDDPNVFRSKSAISFYLFLPTLPRFVFQHSKTKVLKLDGDSLLSMKARRDLNANEMIESLYDCKKA